MIEITEYQPGDLGLMNVRPDDIMVEDPEDYIYGMANVAWDGCTPIAIAGIAVVAPGIGHGWSYVSNDAEPYVIPLVRVMRGTIDQAMENLGLHRVHVTVQASNELYRRFAMLLGFKEEGVMRAASPNKVDMRMMAKVRI
jgi:hypothetical protein